MEQKIQTKNLEDHDENEQPGINSSSGVKSFFTDIAGLFQFIARFFKEVFRPSFYSFSEIIKQAYEIGYKSCGLVAITGFIMGVVLTIQSKPVLSTFGAESMLPSMVSISIIREIGPVITALICAGKVGSGIGAELASMKVTEQIDAMEVSGANPFKYLVVSRILATTFMIPLLVIFSDAVALMGAWIGINITGHVSMALYFTTAFNALTFTDLIPATIKTFFFGFAIGLVGCYKGYNANKGTEGVGIAANSAVVVASLAIFIIDMIAVQITDLFITP
jgi:phospholipid/cholesterol/gamma-HCH transport system permease protein